MEPYLLYRDSSTDGKKSYAFPRDMVKDLNLDIIFKTMAKQDELVYEKVRRVVLLPLTTEDEVLYRQDVLRDFRRQDSMLEDLYAIAVRQNKELKDLKAAIKSNRAKSTKKASELFDCLNYLLKGQDDLIKIRELLLQKKDAWQSEGVKNLLERLKEMPLERIKERLREANSLITGCEAGYTFQFGGGMKMEKAELNFLRPIGDVKKNGLANIYMSLVKRNALLLGTDVTLMDDVNHLAEETLGQIIAIFQPYLQKMMVFYEHYSEEISFYMGVVQFMRRMDELYVTLKMPEPKPVGSKDVSFDQLYELSMAVYSQKKPVGNSITLENNRLTIITGANQGGKSTFLRSYGIAQVLMQCGMPVPASRFSAPLYMQIFTHFTRNEDEHLNNGRLSEELQRMSNMISKTVPNSLFLLNESFASTTEKEGSKIAEGIINAFYEKNITTMMVTHLYQLAKKKYDEAKDGSHFLVAERTENGTRTFKMLPGEPTYTSFGTDLFKVLEG